MEKSPADRHGVYGVAGNIYGEWHLTAMAVAFASYHRRTWRNIPPTASKIPVTQALRCLKGPMFSLLRLHCEIFKEQAGRSRGFGGISLTVIVLPGLSKLCAVCQNATKTSRHIVSRRKSRSAERFPGSYNCRAPTPYRILKRIRRSRRNPSSPANHLRVLLTTTVITGRNGLARSASEKPPVSAESILPPGRYFRPGAISSWELRSRKACATNWRHGAGHARQRLCAALKKFVVKASLHG